MPQLVFLIQHKVRNMTCAVPSSAMNNRLDVYKQLEKTLEKAIQEATLAESDAKFWGWMVVAARTTKIASDIGLAYLSGAATAVGGGLSAGGKVAFDTFKDIGEVIAMGYDPTADEKAMVKKAVKFSTDRKMDALGHAAKAGSGLEKFTKLWDGLGKLTGLIGIYNDSFELVNDIKSAHSGATGIGSARSTAMNQLKQIQAKIRDIKSDMEKCAN